MSLAELSSLCGTSSVLTARSKFANPHEDRRIQGRRTAHQQTRRRLLPVSSMARVSPSRGGSGGSCSAGGRLRRRRTDTVRQGRPDRALRRDACRRHGRRRHSRAAAAQSAAATRPCRRCRHRRDDTKRRPGPHHRTLRRAARGPAILGAGIRHRPNVRRRHDSGDDDRLRHCLRRVRRGDRGRRRAHGPSPDGRGHRPQPAVPGRAARRHLGDGHGLDRGEPARPLPAGDSIPRRRVCRPQSGAAGKGLRRRVGSTRPGPRSAAIRRAGLGASDSGRAAATRNDTSRGSPTCAPHSGRTVT